jgi:hypothetical protein
MSFPLDIWRQQQSQALLLDRESNRNLQAEATEPMQANQSTPNSREDFESVISKIGQKALTESAKVFELATKAAKFVETMGVKQYKVPPFKTFLQLQPLQPMAPLDPLDPKFDKKQKDLIKIQEAYAKKQEELNLKKAKFEVWLNKCEDSRQVLDILTRQVEVIHFDAFRSNLALSIADILMQLKDFDPSEDSQETYVLVEDHKSNKWVAELAMPHFDPERQFSYRTLGEDNATKFCEYLDHLLELKKIDDKTKLPKHIFLFDDGSYSGRQMYEHVNAIIKKYDVIAHDGIGIYVIVPYCTIIAKNKLMDLQREAQSKKIQLLIAKHVEIPTIPQAIERAIQDKAIKESLQGQSLENLLDKINNTLFPKDKLGGCHTRGVFCFDHKIPNTASFIPGLRPFITPVEIPPYKHG